jgi:hypothetical protein
LLSGPSLRHAGSGIEPLENGGVRIVTGKRPGSTRSGFLPEPDEAADGVIALVACPRGEVGVAVLAEEESTHVSPEGMVSAGEKRVVSALVDPADKPA